MYIAFFGSIPHSDISYCLTTLLEYKVTDYIIAMEIAQGHKETSGEHLHFLIKTDDEKFYQNYCKRVFIDKYKLRGRSQTGLPRQYGKVNHIKDIDKMIAYTIKDEKYITNISDLTKYQELSFKKESNEIKSKNPTKTWSIRLTESLRIKYPNHQYKYDAVTIKMLTEEVLLALGQHSKKLSPLIVRDLVFGQYNALRPDCAVFQEFIFEKAFPELFPDYINYLK